MNILGKVRSKSLFTKPSRLVFSNNYSQRKMVKRLVKNTVELNETEKKIKNLLVSFCEEYNQQVKPEDRLELRITGGWVRDKLLGKESNDLDIAINLLSGQDFASKLLEYSQQKGMDLGKNATSLHTIKKNPEKSKHLETCTTKLFGLDIDFVNLRNEQYTEDSRVPVIECGTAEEDALRRDATLNALFYNLNKSEIEDFTGKGLADLENGILRTPLQPLSTFVDDPLRVLRLIRFACRFNFQIESSTLESMKDEKIKTALIHKISRERVGVEMDKILTSDNVPYGLRLLNHLGLTDTVFRVGDLAEVINDINDSATIERLEEAKEALKLKVDQATQSWDSFIEVVASHPDLELSKVMKRLFSSKHGQKLFWLCAILHPFGGIQVKTNPKKASYSSYVELIIKEGLRFGKADYDSTSLVLDKMYTNDTLSQFFASPANLSRADLGMYIRLFGDYFDLNIVANSFHDILSSCSLPDCTEEVPTHETRNEEINPQILESTFNRYQTLVMAINKYGLENVKTLKPIVDGKVISKALQRKPGPWMSKITSEVMKWQLNHPEGTQDECILHIREFLRDESP
ncbi:putative CCA tRNA nucleotidyltransferase [Clavispora lusitaniae]|uniref:CCA tRNA nucleotidyltransferase n=1 Tax=Clavispora lusitaniae TaxID=36911 RepID=A0ACD0WN95_CLALS|nr:putative CCA tRNA nucleotidyltransferase [Clavispora lusitaniae]QFZ34476.1 putative CCA tRNA nucleotidyltransferase [Clavispora lusitaniae]QFZ40161.1 putative CCA tRNA nucleotidyltransferase [Clavispora lusitaniae]QFZ45841.1 putative CCA tRNA nucleotidyltransferase [Clavispora lusitaniae]QFZ51503.1 putative CCA tRNA nucleotidyltransferase [Clavispora lusitaniae]